jgi:nucleoside-diphosphate-sugar epimerase
MISSSPTILVTGANGFIGRHVVGELTCQGLSVYGIDHQEQDLSSAWFEAPESIETIYHFAGQIWGDENTEEAIISNVIQTAKNCGASRIVYASSCSVYGQNAMDCRTDELVEPAPFSSYARGKLAGEELLKSSGLDVTVLRFFNPYGPGQFDKMAVPNMISKAQAGETLEIYGDGQQVRDFIFIRDMAKASIAAAKIGGKFEIFNIGSGVETTINDLAQAIIEATGSSSSITHLPIPQERQALEVHYRVANINKLSGLSGWKPTTMLKTGLARIVAELG